MPPEVKRSTEFMLNRWTAQVVNLACIGGVVSIYISKNNGRPEAMIDRSYSYFWQLV